MSLDKTIRENLDGKYLIIHANQFNEGIGYAHQIQISQIQLRGDVENENADIKIDFKKLESLSDCLRVISFAGIVENIVNFESIYSLKNIEKIYFQHKQKFTVDISKFPKIIHLGSEYWKGLSNFNKAHSLISLVLFKLSDTNLKQLSDLQKLTVLHIYSSQIKTLEGIEKLPIEKLYLARNNYLEDIQAIKELRILKEISVEKCKKIVDFDFIENIKDKVKVEIIR